MRIGSAPREQGRPQSAQKLRVARRPLLARTEYALGEPLIATSAAMTTTPDAKGAPLERWQSRQWQLSIASGAWVHWGHGSIRSRQPPEKGMFMAQFPCDSPDERAEIMEFTPQDHCSPLPALDAHPGSLQR